MIAEVAAHFDDTCVGEPVGISVPGPVKRGVVQLAVNLSSEWSGFDLKARLEPQLGRAVSVLNQADAAGVGE